MDGRFYISFKKGKGWSLPAQWDLVVEKFRKRGVSVLEIKTMLGDISKTQCFNEEYDLVDNKVVLQKLGQLEEEIVFHEAKNNGNFDSYVSAYPNGVYVKEIMALREAKEEENLFVKDQSLQGLKKYLETYPQGYYFRHAEELFFQKCKTFEHYTTYLQFFPQGKYLRDMEEELYQLARHDESLRIKEFYLAHFENGFYVNEVRQMLAKEIAEEKLLEIENLIDLKTYLTQFPDGKYYEEAAVKFLQLCGDDDDFLGFRKFFPDGFRLRGIESILAQLVVRSKSRNISKVYLKEFPKGQNVAVVLRAMDALQSPVKVFISYSREDKDYKNRLVKGLTKLSRKKWIDIWQDDKINAGKDFEKEIFSNLNDSEVIFILISQDFIASEYCYSKELRIALDRHKKKEAKLIPIVIRSTPNWKEEAFGKIQALPKDGEPINLWQDEDSAWTDVIESIEYLVREIRKGR